MHTCIPTHVRVCTHACIDATDAYMNANTHKCMHAHIHAKRHRARAPVPTSTQAVDTRQRVQQSSMIESGCVEKWTANSPSLVHFVQCCKVHTTRAGLSSNAFASSPQSIGPKPNRSWWRISSGSDKRKLQVCGKRLSDLVLRGRRAPLCHIGQTQGRRLLPR